MDGDRLKVAGCGYQGLMLEAESAKQKRSRDGNDRFEKTQRRLNFNIFNELSAMRRELTQPANRLIYPRMPCGNDRF